MIPCTCAVCYPAISNIAFALDASNGDIDSFTRIMRRSYPTFGFFFVTGGIS